MSHKMHLWQTYLLPLSSPSILSLIRFLSFLFFSFLSFLEKLSDIIISKFQNSMI